MSDWNPADPEAASVFYDLGSWTIDQRAEVTAELADADIPHAWDDDELAVPEELEADVDALFDVLEARLGIRSADPIDDREPGPGGPTDEDDEPRREPRQPAEPFDDSAPTTEYDLTEWRRIERTAIGEALHIAQVPHRWEGDVLLVPTDAEDVVDDLLDEIEDADVDLDADGLADRARTAPPPYEVLSEMFLASTRLQRDPLDEEGLDQLHATLDVVEPDLPPIGVARPVWNRAWELAASIADAVAGSDDVDSDAICSSAKELRELLAPLV